jgi:hypothetical protein
VYLSRGGVYVDVPSWVTLSCSSADVFFFDEVKPLDFDRFSEVAEEDVDIKVRYRNVVVVVGDDASNDRAGFRVTGGREEGFLYDSRNRCRVDGLQSAIIG